jgi:hypothetical protein
MDDLRIYNYALDADTLATMYSDMAGGTAAFVPRWTGTATASLTLPILRRLPSRGWNAGCGPIASFIRVTIEDETLGRRSERTPPRYYRLESGPMLP